LYIGLPSKTFISSFPISVSNRQMLVVI